jgi:hypothetical protein
MVDFWAIGYDPFRLTGLGSVGHTCSAGTIIPSPAAIGFRAATPLWPGRNGMLIVGPFDFLPLASVVHMGLCLGNGITFLRSVVWAF